MASTEQQNNINDGVKFTYFHDTESPRVVTVARMLDGDRMYLAWAINRMQRDRVAFMEKGYKPQWHGDIFIKRLARKITRGRVKERKLSIAINEDKNRIEQVVKYFLNDADVPAFVKDIIGNSVLARAKKHLEMATTENEKAARAPA